MITKCDLAVSRTNLLKEAEQVKEVYEQPQHKFICLPSNVVVEGEEGAVDTLDSVLESIDV